MNHHDTLLLFLLLTIILNIAYIARTVQEIEENGGQITFEELQLAVQSICRDISEYLQRKN
jgi:DNA topoisomerase VI subunit B